MITEGPRVGYTCPIYAQFFGHSRTTRGAARGQIFSIFPLAFKSQDTHEHSLVTIEAQRRDLGKIDLGPPLCAHEQLLFIITDEARANGGRR